jgi:hypothetical protein
MAKVTYSRLKIEDYPCDKNIMEWNGLGLEYDALQEVNASQHLTNRKYIIICKGINFWHSRNAS